MTALDLWHRYSRVSPSTGHVVRYLDLHTLRRLAAKPLALRRYLDEIRRDYLADDLEMTREALRESCDAMQRQDNELLTLFLGHVPRLVRAVRSGSWPGWRDELGSWPEVVERIEKELNVNISK